MSVSNKQGTVADQNSRGPARIERRQVKAELLGTATADGAHGRADAQMEQLHTEEKCRSVQHGNFYPCSHIIWTVVVVLRKLSIADLFAHTTWAYSVYLKTTRGFGEARYTATSWIIILREKPREWLPCFPQAQKHCKRVKE